MNSRFVRAPRRLGSGVLVLLAAGCGGKSIAFNDKVEGTVRINGVPLTQVMVQFVPDADVGGGAPTASGSTDGNGRFQLTHNKNKLGAAVGKHHVVILQGRSGGQQSDRDAPDDAASGLRLPIAYSIAAQTPLQVDAQATQHSYDLTVFSQSGSSGKSNGKDD